MFNTFRRHFGSLFACFLGFRGVEIRMRFSVDSGTKAAPERLPKYQNGPNIFEQLKIGFSSTVPYVQTRCWFHFGSSLVAIWDACGTFWLFWGYLLVHFGICWSRDWPGHQTFFCLHFTLISSGLLA